MKAKYSTIQNRSRRFGALSIVTFMGWFMLGAGTSLSAQTPSVATDHNNYLPDEPITASWQNGPGNLKDWIGIYPVDIVPGSANSTSWLYTDGTTSGQKSVKEGSVTFSTGLSLAGDWVAYLLADDGYKILAQTSFKVVDPSLPFVRPGKSIYLVGETISVNFTNGPGNPTDWVGIYPADRQPGNGSSLLWDYVNGTHSATTGSTEGEMSFSGGLGSTGNYVAYLLENDSYTVLASEPFTVTEASAMPRVISMLPANNSSNVWPFAVFSATIKADTRKVLTNSVSLLLDGKPLSFSLLQESNLTTVACTPSTPLAALSSHTYSLRFSDNGTPASWFTNEAVFTVAAWKDIQLPNPIYFEDFDATPEGSLPPGWAVTNYSNIPDENYDLQDLNSKSYADWVVVSRDRFTNTFLSYDSHTTTDDYRRVLTANPLNIVNGKLAGDMAESHFIFADSGYRSGGNQYLILLTPDYDLRGKTNVYLSFHSLYEQNQDSMGLVEYSIDKGATWLPVVYMLDQPVILRDANGAVDAVATLNEPHGDIAVFTDPDTGEQKGGTYGAFIAAPIGPELGPFISGRVNDDTVESKRIELFLLPKADNQAAVRIRFAYVGTDSWYFGMDNFGLYSLPAQGAESVALSIAKSGSDVVISWPASATAFELESADSLVNPQWSKVGGVSSNSVKAPVGTSPKFYRLRK